MKAEDYSFTVGSKRLDIKGVVYNPGQSLPKEVALEAQNLWALLKDGRVIASPHVAPKLFWAQGKSAREAYEINCGSPKPAPKAVEAPPVEDLPLFESSVEPGEAPKRGRPRKSE